MDLRDVDPYLFLYSVVIRLDVRECLLSRLYRLGRLDVSSVLLPVAVILPALSSLILILIEVLLSGLSVLIIIAVASAVLAGLLWLSVLGTLGVLIALVISVSVPVSVPVTVVLAAVLSVAVISVTVSRRSLIIVLSHQITPLVNQQRLYHKT